MYSYQSFLFFLPFLYIYMCSILSYNMCLYCKMFVRWWTVMFKSQIKIIWPICYIELFQYAHTNSNPYSSYLSLDTWMHLLSVCYWGTFLWVSAIYYCYKVVGFRHFLCGHFLKVYELDTQNCKLCVTRETTVFDGCK